MTACSVLLGRVSREGDLDGGTHYSGGLTSHTGGGAEGARMRQEGESGEGEGSLASHVRPGTRAALGRHGAAKRGWIEGEKLGGWGQRSEVMPQVPREMLSASW